MDYLFSVRVSVLSCTFFFSSRRRHTRFDCDWSSDVCSSDLIDPADGAPGAARENVLEHISADRRAEGVIEDIRDLRRYLMLVEAEMAARGARSEERRVGKEGRSRWSPYH